MGYRKQLSEIVEEFESKKTVPERIKVLEDNYSVQLQRLLDLCVKDDKSFVFEDAIPYKPSDLPAGMGYTDALREVDRLYLFIKDHPSAPKTLAHDKKVLLATRLLESMDAKEAVVFHKLITNGRIFKGLTDKVLSGVKRA